MFKNFYKSLLLLLEKQIFVFYFIVGFFWLFVFFFLFFFFGFFFFSHFFFFFEDGLVFSVKVDYGLQKLGFFYNFLDYYNGLHSKIDLQPLFANYYFIDFFYSTFYYEFLYFFKDAEENNFF